MTHYRQEIQSVPEMKQVTADNVLWRWQATDWAEAILVKDDDGVRLFWRYTDGRTTPSYRLHDWEVELLHQLREARVAHDVKAVEVLLVNEPPSKKQEETLFAAEATTVPA